MLARQKYADSILEKCLIRATFCFPGVLTNIRLQPTWTPLCSTYLLHVQCTMCSLSWCLGVPFNIYLSQLVQLEGKHDFRGNRNFQTLNLRFWGYFDWFWMFQNNFDHRAIVLYKEHIVQWTTKYLIIRIRRWITYKIRGKNHCKCFEISWCSHKDDIFLQHIIKCNCRFDMTLDNSYQYEVLSFFTWHLFYWLLPSMCLASLIQYLPTILPLHTQYPLRAPTYHKNSWADVISCLHHRWIFRIRIWEQSQCVNGESPLITCISHNRHNHCSALVTYFFQAGILFSIYRESLFLPNVGYFVANLRNFRCTFYRPK